MIPRGTIYRFRPADDQLHLTFHTPGEIETPKRYRNRYGQLLEGAPFSHRDFHPPASSPPTASAVTTSRRVRDGYQRYGLDYHPLDVVGWDGYVYPYTFNIHDFEPITGRIHQPPPVHQTFQGPNFVICSFCPRMLDFDQDAVPIPYNHSNLQSEEMIYYVSGEFGSRKGVDVGSITLHPSGLPHGPQPGLAEKSIGQTWTGELAVMCDTFRPLRLSALSRALDDGAYALSWYTGDTAGTDGESAAVGGPAGLTSPPSPPAKGVARRSRRPPGGLDVHAPELPAGHVEHLAVHVVRPRRAEKEHGARGLLRGRRPAEGIIIAAIARICSGIPSWISSPSF